MNIDSLISKYLDGELTESEDLQLRNIISSNEKARDIFNTYIDLHIAAKEDAKSITTPEDLVSSTEDIVKQLEMENTERNSYLDTSNNSFNHGVSLDTAKPTRIDPNESQTKEFSLKIADSDLQKEYHDFKKKKNCKC